MSKPEAYMPKIGDRVKIMGEPWGGYVGKVISISWGCEGGYRGARITNPSLKEHGHHSDWYWFSRGRFEKID